MTTNLLTDHIYNNNSIKSVRHLKVLLFADDLNIYKAFRDRELLQIDIFVDALYQWCVRNG